jgi:hypothetical protein
MSKAKEIVMQIPILIEPTAGNAFRAKSGEPLALTVEGATADEAVKKLKCLLESKLHNGTRMTMVDIGPQEHPLARFAGRYDPNDPMIAEWQEAVEEYRRQKDKEDGIL